MSKRGAIQDFKNKEVETAKKEERIQGCRSQLVETEEGRGSDFRSRKQAIEMQKKKDSYVL